MKKYTPFAVIVLLIAILVGGTLTKAATVLLTQTSDTIDTFRTNVNTSLTNLNGGLTGFTTTSYGLATSTILGFTGGFLSSASSTIATLHLGNPLDVPSGGTGVGTLSGLVQGNGVSNMSAVTGTTGQTVYYNGANTVLATTTIFIDTTSKVGIGTTTTPAQALSVQGKIYPTSGIYFNDGTTQTTAASAAASTITTGYATSSVVGITRTVSAFNIAVVAGNVIDWTGYGIKNVSDCNNALDLKAVLKHSGWAATTTFEEQSINGPAANSRCDLTVRGRFVATTTETINVGVDPDASVTTNPDFVSLWYHLKQ